MPLALEDVHRHEDTVREEGRLVHGGRALREGLPRRGQPLLVGVVRQVDQHAAGHVRPGQCPDAAPLVENGPAPWVDLELGRRRLMRHPPQELVALQPLQRAGLRQTDRHIVRWQCSSSCVVDVGRSAEQDIPVREGVGSRAGAVLGWRRFTLMARLSLTLFGGFRARLDPDQALVIAIKKSQALLAYLALPLGQAHPRDKLAALLWGDMQEAQARAGLRQTLYTLRRVLGDPEPLRLVGETVALEPTLVAADVRAFEEGAARGTREALEEAVALYQGDLLEGLTLQEPPFEEWLIAERLRLRELAQDALAKLITQQRDAGALDEAVHAALRLVALDPLQESVHRTLMR